MKSKNGGKRVHLAIKKLKMMFEKLLYFLPEILAWAGLFAVAAHFLPQKIQKMQPEKRLFWQRVRQFALVPICYLGSVGLFLSFLFSGEPPRKFDRAGWFAAPHERHRMRQDLIEKRLLDGQSKAEIRELIGSPTHGDSTDRWQFDLGTGSAGFGFLDCSMAVEFENGRAVRIRNLELVD